MRQILVAIAAIVCAILLLAMGARAADTPIPDLTGGNWQGDYTYQGYDTQAALTFVLTNDGGGSGIKTYNVTGQQHTFIGGDIGGAICDETVSGSLTTEPDHIITDSHGSNTVTFGTASLFAVPSASGCPSNRAPFLHLAFKGLVGDDCDSVVEATAPPFVCNEHLWTSGPDSYAKRTGIATKYPIVGSLLYPDAEDTSAPEVVQGYFNPNTNQFYPGYWIARSYSCFIATSAPVTVDPSAVVTESGTHSPCGGGGPLTWLPFSCLLPDASCYAPSPNVQLNFNVIPDAVAGSFGFL